MWPRACASSSSAKVESPRTLIRSIGSICTATFNAMNDPLENLSVRTDNVNERLTSYRQSACPSHGETMPRFPRLSIASKLYAIFALLATATVVLALVAVVSARRHAALTDEFELALQGSQNVERINGLIYAVVMESRGIYMSEDAPNRKKYADGLLKFNDQILQIVNDWERKLGAQYKAEFKPFA